MQQCSIKRPIRIATICSGIGAPEWALKRMGLPYEIVFACDNNEIKVEYNLLEEWEKIRSLSSFEEKKEYVDQLYAQSRKTNFVKKSYLSNHELDESKFYQDAFLLDGTDFRGDVDLFVAGVPCQSWSGAGYRKGFDDQRGQLFYEFCRLVNEIQPKVFIFENVKGMLSQNQGKSWETIKESFNNLGYKIYWQVLNSKDYGVPQSRPRLFVIGFLNHDINYEFPKPIPLQLKMRDLLDGFANSKFNLESSEIVLSKENKNYTPEKYFLSDKMIKTVTAEHPEHNFNSQAEIDREVATSLLSTMGKMHWAGMDNYVTDLKPVDEKYFLSQKMIDYAFTEKNWNKNPTVDREIANTVVSTYHKMHKAGLDNYVTDLVSKKDEQDEEESNS